MMKKGSSNSLIPTNPPPPSSDEDEVEDKEEQTSTCSICGASFKTIRSFAFHQRFCLPRGEDEEDVIDEFWLDGKSLELQSRSYAHAALLYLNNCQDSTSNNIEYKLVKPGPFQATGIGYGPIIHFNFRAKPKDSPEAQVETFFAQLRIHPPHHPFEVDCCVSLGTDVPHFNQANTYGCTYCTCLVHHPAPTIQCPRLFTGSNREDASWLYGDNHDNGFDSHISSDSD